LRRGKIEEKESGKWGLVEEAAGESEGKGSINNLNYF
jgi:hypothetical protein